MPPSFAAPTIVWTFAAVCGPLTLLAQDPRATARDAVSSPAVAAQIDRYLTRLVPFGYSGNVLIAQRGQIIMAKGYGFANRAQQLPFTERTVVPMGSLVKPFTMLAILQLEHDGKLRTTDSLHRFFPEAPADKRNITIDQLLVHSSGLPLDVGTGDRGALAKDEFLRRLFAAPLRFPPGSGREYSNGGYALLASIVERVTDSEFETVVRDGILLPAGMLQTGWRDPAWGGDTVAHVYARGGEDFGTMLEAAKSDDGGINWNQRGNGGWLTTAQDLYRWHRAMLSGAILDSSGRRKHEWTARPRVALAGGNGAFETVIEYDAGRDLFIFVHNNANGPLATPIARTIATIALGRAVAPPPAVVAVPRAALARLVGRYQLATGGRLAIDTAGGALVVASEGQVAVDAITGADPAGSREREAVSAYTDTVLRAWRAGDWRPMHRAFGAAAPLDEFIRRQTAMRARFDSRLGAVTGYAVLGTRRQGQAMMTRVRVDRERGSEFESYGWADRSIVLFAFDDAPPTDRFLPESATRFVNVDPRNGAIVRLAAVRGGGLAIESAHGRVVAERVR